MYKWRNREESLPASGTLVRIRNDDTFNLVAFSDGVVFLLRIEVQLKFNITIGFFFFR